MSTIKNQVVLIGNLGNDPEVTNFESGSSIAKFSMATNETYKKENGEKTTQTEWHTIVVWGNLVSIVERYLKKGSEVCIKGKITYRNYQDKQDITKYITEIKADEVLILGNKQELSEAEVSNLEVQQ
jgi:single-strand DNA-binding protein